MRRTSILIAVMIFLGSMLILNLIHVKSFGRKGLEIVPEVEAQGNPNNLNVQAYSGTCSNSSLKGTYGISLTATIEGIGLGAALGTMTFDGEGQITGSGTAHVIGITREATISGTYSVNPDCTGEASTTSSGGLSAVGTFVIVSAGKEVLFIGTSPEGSTPQAFLSGSAKKLK